MELLSFVAVLGRARRRRRRRSKKRPMCGRRRKSIYVSKIRADSVCSRGVEGEDRCGSAQIIEELTITPICKELIQLGFDSISVCVFLKDFAETMCLGFNMTVTNFCVKRCGKRAHDLDCREELRFTA
jgi:hypothetical protein